jgi:prophage regulatory protein
MSENPPRTFEAGLPPASQIRPGTSFARADADERPALPKTDGRAVAFDSWFGGTRERKERAPARPIMAHAASKRPASTPQSVLSEGAIWISVKHAADLLDVSEATIWRWMKTLPNFPKASRLSPGCTRLKIDEVLAFPKSCEGKDGA